MEGNAMKKKMTKEAIARTIELVGGATEFFRLMRERRDNPNGRLTKDENGRYSYR